MTSNICAMPSWTSPTSQPLAGVPCGAEGQLAGGRDLQAHLVLDVGDEDAVALARLAGLGVEQELRHEEQAQTLGARAGALGAGQHQWKMFSNRSSESPEVMNRLTPSMCQVPSGCSIALVRPAPTSEPASGSVSTMVAPQSRSTARAAQCFCSLVAVVVEQLRERGPARYMKPAGLAPSMNSVIAQVTERWGGDAADLLAEADLEPVAVGARP